MKYFIVPPPVVLKNLETGAPLDNLVASSGVKRENRFSMRTFFLDYISIGLKTFKEHRAGNRIDKALEKAEAARASGDESPVAELTPEDTELLRNKIAEAQIPGFVGMQLVCFGEAVEDAKSDKPKSSS